MTHDIKKRSSRTAAESVPSRELTQYSAGKTLAVWAAAAVPMGILSWVVAPILATMLDGPAPLGEALLILLSIGLAWQFVLVMWLVWREQGSLRWGVLREALWLNPPRSPRTGRFGGRVWLILIPLGLLFFLEGFIPRIAPPAGRDFGAFLGSQAGEAFFDGAWGWYGLMIALWVFNTVLGEELLFRGLLLPRMNRAFGRFDWLVNGVLFAAYHLHMPWAIPTILTDALVLAYPTKRYRSAWIGIAVHSTQSVFLAVIVLTLVL
ncbi:MAG TPA: type II CAAX endopeptidase family protein [Acidimicrobiia bacterium]|nr:type II CAAX endopeptidase family protein [Acidimicrobiia bacterium]